MMKQAIFVATAGFLGLLSSASVWAETMVVATDRANVRSIPSTTGAVLGTATRGLRVQELSAENGWSNVEISTDNGVITGWIKTELLRTAAGTVSESIPDNEYAAEYVTDYGVLVEERIGTKTRYVFNGTEISFGEYANPASLQAQFGNHFLMMETAGAFCPVSFLWMSATQSGMKVTDTFGTCMEGYEVTEGEGWIELEMPNANGQIERYRYDGQSVELRVIDKPEPVVENSMDPSAWIGKSAYDYLSASTTENYLLSLMSLADLERISRSSMSRVQPFTEDGDWIVAVGRFEYFAMARYDGVAKVMVALSKDTNEAFIHFVQEEENGSLTTEFWGKKPENLTGTMRKAMTR